MITLSDMLVDSLRHLHGVERQQLIFLQDLMDAAVTPELEKSLREHLGATKNQIARQDKIFEAIGQRPDGAITAGAKGIIEEGHARIERYVNSPFLDLALIYSACEMEQYEIAGYEGALTLFRQTNLGDGVKLLEEILSEERQSYRTLMNLAEPLAAAAVREGGRRTA